MLEAFGGESIEMIQVPDAFDEVLLKFLAAT